MNTFTCYKTGDIPAGQYWGFDYTTPSRLCAIHVAVKKDATVDIYLGNSTSLPQIFGLFLNANQPNYTIYFQEPLILSAANILRLVITNTHATEAQPMSATLGLMA